MKLTQEEKQLLLKDLSARIPYQPLCKITDTEYDFCECDGQLGYSLRDFVGNNVIIKPYLRPMSSMTKEEKYTYRHMLGATLNSEKESIMFVYVEDFPTVIDWLNAHHFDYRGLIEKGLALEAPEDMYKEG